MTYPPGDDQPQDPYRQPPPDPSGQPPSDQPPYGQPPYGQPQYGQPQYGQPQYGQPQYGQPQYGQPEYGEPQYGQQPGGAHPQQGGFPPMGYPGQDHPKATTALVLGILGIVICGVIAPFAWRMGKRTVAEIDASNGQLGGRGAAQAGYVLGVIGTVLLGLGLLALVLFAVLISFGVATSSSAP
jgi:hypothetical protein